MTTDPSASDESSDDGSHRLLVLMRHAKSDWGDSSLSDHDRPLNPRGKRDAPRMADWLTQVDAIPTRILCSSASRTRETVALMCPQWSEQPDVSYRESLYLSAPETILAAIHGDGLEARALMVVAHNPGITHLACLLAGQSIEMPTAAIAVFRIDLGDWLSLRPSGPATLVQYMRPKAL